MRHESASNAAEESTEECWSLGPEEVHSQRTRLPATPQKIGRSPAHVSRGIYGPFVAASKALGALEPVAKLNPCE